MSSIITLRQHKVVAVNMSPCEKYVMTYSPMGDKAYTVWNFEMTEVIREFDQEMGEDENTFKWSHDGSYLAKKFRTETEV